MSLKEFYRVLRIEAKAIDQNAEQFEKNPALNAMLSGALNAILERTQNGGKVIVLGVGKSGKIGAKISATFSSTGTPSIFVHPTEALHGDLGIVNDSDIAFAISHTGNTEELVSLLPFFERRKVPVIGLGSNPASKLAKKCTFYLHAQVTEEACAHNLAPTTSTTVALAIGDALAMTLMQMRGFGPDDFAKNHPGGSLGRRLQLLVSDLMHDLQNAPVTSGAATMDEVLKLSTEKKLGAVLICENQKLVGLITDGDIRRALSHREKFFTLTAQDIMTKNPTSVSDSLLAYDALRLMEERESQISVLPVVNTQGHAVGLLRIHDLVQTL
jgi:arabinose-5-phosphate isomerase